MFRVSRFVIVAAMFVTFVSSQGQTQVEPYPRMTTFTQYLGQKGIKSRAAIIAALTDSDPETRGIAAYKLAEDRDSEAVTLIANALHNEANARVQVNLASALWSLDAEEGVIFLNSLCESTTSADDVVRLATRQLMLRQVGGVCTPRLIAMYSQQQDLNGKVVLLSLLAGVASNAPASAELSLLSLGKEALTERRSDVRLTAVQMLGQIKTAASKKVLRDASASETDPVIKRRIDETNARITLTSPSHPKPLSSSRPAGVLLDSGPGRMRSEGQCVSQTCPSSVTLSTTSVEPLPPLVPHYLTGVGIAATMTVGPSTTNFANDTILESLSTIISSCPAQFSSNGNFCPGGGVFTVGQGGYDPIERQSYPALQNVFYDNHSTLSTEDLVGTYNAGNSCSVDCAQQYTCNGAVIGSFTITRDHIRDYVTGTDGNTYPVTSVIVNKR